MATTYLAPDPIQSTQLIPGGAVPANGGQLFFYLAGTNTKSTVYKDNAAAVAHTNPIVLDSGGNIPSGGEVWFASGVTYKVVFAPATDTDPPVSPYWTKDNLAGMNDVSATASEWISGATPTFVSTKSFTLVGDQTSTFTVGRRIRTVNSGGTVYSTVLVSSFGALTTITVANDSGVLDSGLSAVAYSILGTAQPSLPAVTIYAMPEVKGRLTLLPGQPITTSDVTLATSVMFTPYKGNIIDLYDGASKWVRRTFAEVAIAVPSSTAVYDVFAYQSSGVVSLSTLAWTNFTTRATSLTTQAGIYVQSGDATKLYLGTFCASTVSGTTVVTDSEKDRRIFNAWNAQDRVSAVTTGAIITLTTSGAFLPMVTDSSYAATIVHGFPWSIYKLTISGQSKMSVATTVSARYMGIALDSFNNVSSGTAGYAEDTTNQSKQMNAIYIGSPGIGLHSFARVNMFTGVTSCIFFVSAALGDQPGFRGEFNG